jgi:hypothetical protein
LSLEWTSLLLPFSYSEELFKTVNFVAAFGAHYNLPSLLWTKVAKRKFILAH